MAEKKYKGCPFGVQTARFDISGVHPKNKTPGTFTQTPYCRLATNSVNSLLGPGRYNVESYGEFSSSAVADRASGPGWARQCEVAQLAAMPHQLHKDQWDLNRLLHKKLGPGTYEIKDFLQASEEQPKSIRGIIQTKEPRFRERIKMELTPGPGTYGDGGVPQAAKEEKAKQSPGTIGLLDAGASGARSLPTVGSKLAPGRYNFDSFTDQAQKKVTSLRGPYDLYSGDRNKPIRTGHYAAPHHAPLGPGQYEIPSFVEELQSTHKKKQGRFGRVDQHPENPTERIYGFTLSQNPRVAEQPGPGTHEPKTLAKPPAQAKKSPAFLSSAPRTDRMSTKFFTGNFNAVGAGRYDIQKYEEAQDTNGHISVFKSKTVKPDLTTGKFMHERIRAKDVRVKDRVFMVEPDTPERYINRTKTHLDRLAPQKMFTGHRAITVI